MDIRNIQNLIDSYFEGKTSEKEEEFLFRFFSKEDVPSELEEHMDYFRNLKVVRSYINFTSLDNKINAFFDSIEDDEPEKKQRSWLLLVAASVAVLIIGFGVVTNFALDLKDSKSQLSSLDTVEKQELYVSTLRNEILPVEGDSIETNLKKVERPIDKKNKLLRKTAKEESPKLVEELSAEDRANLKEASALLSSMGGIIKEEITKNSELIQETKEKINKQKNEQYEKIKNVISNYSIIL